MADAGGKKRKGIRWLAYGVYLFVLVFLLLEIALRIYNPFHFRLKGNQIILPINQRELITNKINPKLDAQITVSRNSLGFRGPEPPAGWNRGRDRDAYLSFITIGGSTTECHFLSDDRTWPYLLGRSLADSCRRSWLNNAGLDGHSTYGHLILLNDYVKKLRPSVILFLTGINDIETAGPLFHDKLNTRNGYPDFLHFIFNNSEVLNVALNIVRGWRAQKFNNTTNSMLVLDTLHRLVLPDTVMQKRLAVQAPYLAAYRKRLTELADTCLAWHILPVFLTQPNQFGTGRDPLTGADLETYPVDPSDPEINGLLIWKILEEYNDVVRGVCLEKGLPTVDLAHLLPKNSLYFYDMSHFTNLGAGKVSEVLTTAMAPILRAHFPLSCR
jgi:GDSL-like Lipase/Acylhydrolase family